MSAGLLLPPIAPLKSIFDGPVGLFARTPRFGLEVACKECFSAGRSEAAARSWPIHYSHSLM